MSEELLANFALLAASEGGIAKLRELILVLAVRGKLVPQDAKDEPARELLRKMSAEKERLVAEGKIKREKPLPAIGDEEKPFELPAGWQWVKLQTAYDVRDGTHDSPKYLSSGIPFLTSKNIFTGQLDFSDVKYISTQDHNLFSQRSKVDEEDILFAMIGSIGNPAIVNTDVEFSFKNMALFKYYSRTLSNPRYLLLFLSAVSKTLKERAAGGVQSFVPLNILRNTPIPLPPLPEQSRIVAKVEALMALCDRLEVQQGDAARVQAHWMQAALDQLAESGNADEFARHWRALADHFDTLFATPASIDAFEATLLQLAVRGRLVPQNPADEPASELLKKIRAEKDRLIAEGKIKRDKPLPPIADDEKPFELPEGWEWTRLDCIGQSFDYGTSQKATELPRGTPVLRMGNVNGGRVLLTNLKYFEDRDAELPALHLQPGDLLFNRTNSYELVGKTGMYDGPENKFSYASYLIRIRSMHGFVAPKYVNVFMNSTTCRLTQIEPQIVQQNGQANFNGTKLRGIAIPLPPLHEQSRIVAKLDELLALTRALRVRLTDARAVQAHLASALVDEVAAC